MAAIVKHYYIIKVVASEVNKVYYKIGEGNTIDRPNKLIKKYNDRRVNTATLLAFEELPANNKARLTDKGIHAHIDSSIMIKADSHYINNVVFKNVGEDGSAEFFETVTAMSDQEIVDYVAKVVKSIKAKEFTGKIVENTKLTYKPDQIHLVSADLLETYILNKPEINRIIYQDVMNPILLIGQFEHEFICSIACYNKVYIWHDSAEQKHEYKMSKINNNLIYIDTLEELLNMDQKFDLIIANPPYGKIGANITKAIIDEVEFDEYINLLPANDYKRNDTKDLFNYQSDMVSIKDGFADAAVTTHGAKIHKNKVNNMTVDEFEISNYTDKSLFKYFTENRIRKHYAIDAANLSGATDKQFKLFDINKTVTISSRDVAHSHLPYSKTCETYRWNVLKNITSAEIFESRKAMRKGLYDGWLSITGILNNTEIEKDNQVAFMYGQDGFRFLAKVFTAVNADSSLNFGKVFPKVDWTRSWTVEEILADYGYTAEEIQAVMEDLKNYKGMED